MSFIRTPWMLTLDADDIVLNPERIKPLCEWAHKERITSLWASYDQDASTIQKRLSVVKTRDYHWVGAVHESLQAKRPGNESAITDIKIKHAKPMERAKPAARQYLDILLEKNPDHHSAIADSYRLLGELEQAETHYYQAIKQEHLNDETKYHCALNGLNVCLQLAEQNQEYWGLGLVYLDLCLALKPRRAEGWYYAGVLYAGMGHKDKARTCYETAKALKMPEHETGLVYKLYYEPKLYEQCLSNLEEAA